MSIADALVTYARLLAPYPEHVTRRVLRYLMARDARSGWFLEEM